MTVRMIIVTLLLLVGAAFLESATRIEAVPIRESLTAFPNRIDGWTGRHLPIDEEILAIAGVDDYASRLYVDETRSEARRTAELYIGYYATQREGHTMHSTPDCLPGSGRAARALRVDVSDSQSLRAMLKQTVDRFGRLDVLVNNAGYGIPGSVVETDEADWDRLMSATLNGVFYGCKYAIPIMRK